MPASGQGLELFGVKLIGATPENAHKLVLTIAVIVGVWLVGAILRRVLAAIGHGIDSPRFRFWTQQGLSILLFLIVVVGTLSVWFDDPGRLSTAFGLVTAGIAFALQRVITAVAGYFVILRGKTFNVGDRIVMGGVRGDVISLSFMQTKIMEMGESPPVEESHPGVWIHSRQFTGRIVTVTNDKIFDEPVYNYTHHFPYIWEEMRVPIRYGDARERDEEILLAAARRHAVTTERIAPEQLKSLEERYNLTGLDIEPRVYWRLTDNWIELALRFLTAEHGSRGVKDAMTREIINNLDAAGIPIASATQEVTILSPEK
jgi:small-conductance mechanosensitive channel